MQLIDPTAKQSDFQSFYHYQRFNRDHLTVMLRDQKLFCSDPHNVNDPWDCKPWFDYRPILADPVKREAMITFFHQHLPPETLNDPRRPIYENLLRTSDQHLRQAVERSSAILGAEIGKRRIYCLTPFPDKTLMWSHYAANHRGICLEFDKNNSLIGRARPVKYRETYPEWIPTTATQRTLELVLTKSMDWAYEREFRIIATSLDGPTKLFDDYVLLPTGALTSIILGCESKDHDEISDIIKKYAPAVSIKRAVRVPNHYKLRIEG